MKILAIETSGDWCSVALWRDGEVKECALRAGNRQSGHVLDLVHDVLSAQGEAVRDMDGFAYGAGPGAFTGLRIACGVVQGLAFGADKPVLGIGTLLALAEQSGAARAVCCIDARMNEIYHAAYEKRDGAWAMVHEPVVCGAAQAPPLPGAGWKAMGNGFAVYADALNACYGARLAGIDADAVPRARDIAVLAAPLFARGEGQPADSATPLYVRDRVALKTGER
jgi:tRNA threonylcarbamoyladenosine biosynthesis protein TsaB